MSRRSSLISGIASLIRSQRQGETVSEEAVGLVAAVSGASGSEIETCQPAPPELPPAAEVLREAMVTLTHVLDQETEIVTGPVIDSTLGTLPYEKGDAEARYRGALAAFQCETNGDTPLPADTRLRLTEAATALAAATERNMRAVTEARNAQEHMIGLIVESIKRHRQEAGGYAHLARSITVPYGRPLSPQPAAINCSL